MRHKSNRMNKFSLFLSMVGSYFVLSSASMATCLSPSPFPYPVFASAAQFASSGKYGLDDKGILTFDYGRAYGGLGRWHNPFFIARYAHALYRDWQETLCKDDSLRDKFLLQATWLLENHQEVDGMALWTYPFANSYFGVEAGWISGIGQSHIAGVLFRAHALTGDRRFEQTGRKAIEPYLRSIVDGGVVSEGPDGLWIQEVPNRNGKAYNILNGHITGLVGLIDVSQFDPDERIRDVVHRSIDAVRDNIEKFDAGFTSFYSLHAKDGEPHRLAPRQNYNVLHTSQMLMLYELDGDPLFLKMAMRLQQYELLDDIRTAKNSTNASTHPPSQAAGYFGTRFWSDNQFPTWYEVDLKSPTLLTGLFIGSYIESARPKAFTISIATNDGDWTPIWHTDENQNKDTYLEFVSPTAISKFRIDILADSGNRNVAFNAIMPIRADPGLAPVTNYCNYRVSRAGGTMSYNVQHALDDDPNTSMAIHCDGYVVLPPTAGGSLTIQGSNKPTVELPVAVSTDLHNWTMVGSLRTDGADSLNVDAAKYIRIGFRKDVGSLDGIRFRARQETLGSAPLRSSDYTDYRELAGNGELRDADFFPGFRLRHTVASHGGAVE